MKKFLTLLLVLLVAGTVQAKTDRIVVSELFTSVACGWCPSAELAMEELMEDLGPDTLIGVQVHLAPPFMNQWSTTRANYYGVYGTPTMIFDGISKVVGGGSGLYETYLSRIESRLFYQSYIDMDLNGSISSADGEGTVTLTLTVLDRLSWKNMKARFYVYEDNCDHNGKTYHYVMRKMLEDEDVTIKNPGEQQVITRSFTIDPTWKPEDIGVIAFVQEDDWKEVLQSGEMSRVRFDVSGPENAYLGTTYDYSVSVQNITDMDVEADFWIDVYLPNGAPSPGNPLVGPQTAPLPGNFNGTFPQSFVIPDSAPLGTYEIRSCVGQYPEDVWYYDSLIITLNP